MYASYHTLSWRSELSGPLCSQALSEFLDHFAIDPVLTADQACQAGRLRHQVYCEERGYEPTTPNGIEADRHDADSLHCLLTHRRTGSPAGCVRLICASEDATLALEDYCLGALHLDFMNTLGTSRDHVCEVSRLAVAPAFRMGTGRCDDVASISNFTESERLCAALVTAATFLSAIATADLTGRSNVFAVMAAPLPRLLRRFGIGVNQAGDFMDHHGRRAPHFITVEEAVAGMHPDVAAFYQSIRATLAEGEERQVFIAAA